MTTTFADNLLAWYQRQGRSLPWRGTRDPYPIWLSEIMLQQTQVATVRPYYRRFLERFPTLADLAAAPQDAVLAEWSGLGYYSRARNLHAAAQRIRDEHGGHFPDDYTDVVALPGIGPSTAGAILSFAFDQDHAILDGNVRRVLARIDALEDDPRSTPAERHLWARARELTPAGWARDYNQAIMDLGATVCTRARPDCGACPVAGHCRARREGRQDEIPVRKPRKAKPARPVWLALIQSPEGLLLERRPPSGFWGGLWAPPMVARGNDAEAAPDPDAAATELARRLGGTFYPGEEGTAFRRTFSHFHLDLLPLHLTWDGAPAGDRDLIWAGAATRAHLGLPADIVTLLDTLA